MPVFGISAGSQAGSALGGGAAIAAGFGGSAAGRGVVRFGIGELLAITMTLDDGIEFCNGSVATTYRVRWAETGTVDRYFIGTAEGPLARRGSMSRSLAVFRFAGLAAGGRVRGGGLGRADW